MPKLETILTIWQGRELRARRTRGLAQWLSIFLGCLALACFCDWYIDRYIETPFWLRIGMTSFQVVLGLGLLVHLVIRLKAPSLDGYASRAEQLIPSVGHRFVTALQLARPGARTQGMSSELIEKVIEEAEEAAKQNDLEAFADRQPYKQAAYILVPLLLVSLGGTLLRPSTVATLLARQVLQSVDIDRGLSIQNQTPEVLPAGERFRVLLVATGDVPDDGTGQVVVETEGQPSTYLECRVLERLSDQKVLLGAELPASTKPVHFHAWFCGARLRQQGHVRFEARPVVRDIEAEVILPSYVDPKGEREYRRYQPLGEIYALVDMDVSIQASFSKPVDRAAVAFIRRDAAGEEVELTRKWLDLAADRTKASTRCTPPPESTGYRIYAQDDLGFENRFPPLRGITLSADRPPEVRLLPEILKDPKEPGPLDDFSVEGMPLRLGGQIQVGYYAKSPLGCDQAYLVYRVNDGPWEALPLTLTKADETKVGPFLPDLGLFQESGPFGQVEFYPIPAKDPEQEPDGLAAGGRINFKTLSLKKKIQQADADQSIETELELGDVVEIRIAVYDRKPGDRVPPTAVPASAGSASSAQGESKSAEEPLFSRRRVPGWSPESRIKTVVSDERFFAWRQDYYRTRVKLNELEQKQRAVFQQD